MSYRCTIERRTKMSSFDAPVSRTLRTVVLLGAVMFSASLPSAGKCLSVK